MESDSVRQDLVAELAETLDAEALHDPKSLGFPTAAWDMVVTLGKCRISGVEPPEELDGTPPVDIVVAAGAEGARRLDGMADLIRGFSEELADSQEEIEDGPCTVLELLFEACAAHITIDEAELACLHENDLAAAGEIERTTSQLADAEARIEAMIKPNLRSFVPVCDTSLLQNFRRMLPGSKYADTAPWWIDAIEDEAARLEREVGVRLLRTGKPAAAIEPKTHKFSRSTMRIGWGRWLAMAACLAIAATVVFRIIDGRRRDPGTSLTLAWHDVSTAITPSETWVPASVSLGTGSPELNNVSTPALMGGGEVPIETVLKWRSATVLIISRDGFGSGALISADGWILTSYHVVASDLQDAAIDGSVPEFDIRTCDTKNRALVVRPEVSKAIVYRADPVQDLALLKLKSLPGVNSLPFSSLAKNEASANEKCYAIGSPDREAPWSVISGEVRAVPGTEKAVFEYPMTSDPITSEVLGLRELQGDALAMRCAVARPRTTVVSTNCPTAEGASGGPLVDTDGNLIGLTFATPSNTSVYKVGFHVSLEAIRTFINKMPVEPERVPFDVWTGGLSHTALHLPESITLPEHATTRAVLFSLTDGTKPAAVTMYFQSDGPKQEPVGKGRIPKGLWGLSAEGTFAFNMGIVFRSDGVVAAAYTDPNEVVSEIRVGRKDPKASTTVWRKGADGQWRVTIKPGVITIDTSPLSRQQEERLTSLMQYWQASKHADSPSSRP